MTLTPDDIKRPAVIRLNRVINTLTGIVWLPLAWVCWAVGMLAVGLDNAFEWSFDKAMTLRTCLLEAFVKRWPTQKEPLCYLCGESLVGGRERAITKYGLAHYACWQHPKNWSAPVPISEARKTDPVVEAVAQKIERGEVSLS